MRDARAPAVLIARIPILADAPDSLRQHTFRRRSTLVRRKTLQSCVERPQDDTKMARFIARVLLGWEQGDEKSVPEQMPPPGVITFRHPTIP